jgi:alcohol dehydrogenase
LDVRLTKPEDRGIVLNKPRFVRRAMPAYSFRSVPEISVECGAAARLGELLSERFSIGRVVIVTDKFLVNSGLVSPALTSLEAAGWQVLVCDDVQADPPDHVVMSAVEKACAFGAEVVVGLGGGSSMDVAKLVAVLSGSPQELSTMYGIDQVVGERLPLVQIPTTAGTGSEVTAISIVTTGETTKSGIVSRQLYADLAILDATLTIGLPGPVTAATGIDAIVHAIEAFTSKLKKNPLSDHAASLALKLLSANLVPAIRNGSDLQVRENMLLGSMLAGQAFANAPVAAVHALAYPLGGHYHIPHGLSNALVLNHVLRFNLDSAVSHYAGLAELVIPSANGSDESKAEAFIEHIQGLINEAGLPMRLRDHRVTEDFLEHLAADAMKQQRLLMNNPREMTEADALAIYQAAF